MSTFFDAVMDENCGILFNGTRVEVVEWLIAGSHDTKFQATLQVCEGRTLAMKSIDRYLKDHDKVK